MTAAPDPVSGLRWIRPVKRHSALLPGDIRYADGTLMRPGDVVRWQAAPLPAPPPHVEDALVDPVRDRPLLLRRRAAAARAQFCATHLDRAPADVLCRQTRSLCLLRPASARATWDRDPYSGRYEARMAFQSQEFSTDERGLPVTDLAWRALGRDWLAGRARLELDDAALHERIGPVCLAIGLGRAFEGRHWPLVIGVHAPGLPDVEIDESEL